MGLIPAGALPHVKRFGWSGVLALGVVIVMLAGINPITLISGKVSPPPPPRPAERERERRHALRSVGWWPTPALPQRGRE